MSNTDLMVPEQAGLPAYAVNKEAAAEDWGDLMAGMPVGAPPRLKLNGKQFVMVNSAGEETPFPTGKLFVGPDDEAYLKMMILAGRPQLQKAWYSQKYNPNDETHAAPDCFSNNGEHPDATAPSAQSDSCANCPKNAFGSGVDQNGAATGGKACTDIKIMAVFIPNHGIFSFKIPPGSFKNWSALGKQLKSAGIRPGYVVYLVGFEPAESYPVLTFKYGGVVPEQFIPALAEKAESAETVEILTNRITGGGAAPAKEKEEVPEVVGETADDLGLGLDDASGDLGLGEDLNKPTSPSVDKSGTPHNPALHASTKTCTVDGFWKVKPGLSEEDKAKAAALRAGSSAGTTAADTTAATNTTAATDTPSDEDLAASLGL